MRIFVYAFFILGISGGMCGALSAHPRSESSVEWVSTIDGLDKFGKETRSLAIDLKVAGDRALIDAVVRKFPELRELKLYSFPQKIHPSIFESLHGLNELESLEVSGDVRLSEKDYALIGRMTRLRYLSFSLP